MKRITEMWMNTSLPPDEGKYILQMWTQWVIFSTISVMERSCEGCLFGGSNASPIQGVSFTAAYKYFCDLWNWIHKASSQARVTHSVLTSRALVSKKKMQAEEYNRRGNYSCVLLYCLIFVCVKVLRCLLLQVRSWWITSPSTCAPSGRGGWFQMWSQVTWGSFSLTLRLQRQRTGRVSSTTLRKSLCQE